VDTALAKHWRRGWLVYGQAGALLAACCVGLACVDSESLLQTCAVTHVDGRARARWLTGCVWRVGVAAGCRFPC
jgi:hypothetical protein